jgi:hypothetical protein
VCFVIWPRFPKRNKTAIFLIGAFVFFLVSDCTFCLAQSGPVAAYAFDEGSGTTVKDSSGNNLTGTIAGATWTTGGMYGNALSFNGTSSYVDLGNPTGLQLTGSITIEAWVKAAANPSNDGEIVAKASTAGWLLKTTPDTGPETFGIRLSANSSTNIQRYSTTVRSLSTWYHVAGVYDAVAQTLSTYVNGALDNGTLLGTVPAAQYNANVNVNIGRRVSGYYFNGVIDEVRIYNRALSQAEIQTDMITPVSGASLPPDTTPPTVAISSPADGATVAGTTALTASASDNVGVAGVQFLLDSANLGNEVASAPFTLQWNTSTTGIGTHTLSAVARDFSGNTATSDSISVNVSNPSAAQVGQWTGVMNWPMVAVHAEMLPTGNVLAWTDYTTNGGAQIWRPATNTFTPKTYTTTSLFCSGHSYMADGRLLVVGGIVGLTDDLGPQNGTIFDPVTETWSESSLMVTGRYYPTSTTLPDGRILVQGGTTTCSTCIADMPEIYDPVSNTWTQMAASARMAFKYYPHGFVLPDGRVLVSSEDDQAISSRVLDLNSQTWTTVDSRIFDGHSSAMYLPGKVIKAGTATADHQGYPAAATTYVLDMTQSSPAWQQTASMAFPRSYLNLTLLPDGTVLATGGSTTTDKANFAAAVYEAELWSPVTQKWTTMARSQTPRLYHSTALLLPDARVLVAGGGRENGRSQPDPKDEPNAEIFSPPYLFKGPRPSITSAPSTIQYGNSFAVATPDVARIASVSLIALSAVTHAFNENQRFVPLAFEQASGSLNVHAPANGNLAPPGPYMLFIVDTNGVPSVAAMTRLPAPNASSNPAPTVSSISPASGTAAGGTAVNITGTGFLAGATVRLGGTAATSVTVVSGTSITATTPPGTAGAVAVTVTNTDGQSGILPSGYTYTSSTGGGGTIRFVQVKAANPQSASSSVTVAFAAAQTAGNLNIVAVGWNDTTSTVSSIRDTRGNSYSLAVGPTTGTSLRQSIYYARNIAGGSNTVTVTFNQAAAAVDVRALEYSGLDMASPLDVTTGAAGTGTSANSGTATSKAANELIFGAGMTRTHFTGGGSGFTSRIITNPDADIAEDQIVSNMGSYSATAPTTSSSWVMQMATFRAGGQGSGNPSPTVTNITPTGGTTAGGTAVTINGTGFMAGATVSLAGTAMAGVTIVDSTTITATTPAHTSGAVNVVVTNTDSQSGTLPNGYTYISPNPAPTVATIAPTSGTTAGGTAVTITGTGFLAGATVNLGGTTAAGITVVNSTTITATTPAHTSGAVNIVVTNADTQSGTFPNGYTYISPNPAPTVATVTPTSGTTAGGTAVTITGAGFLAGARVSLGGAAATGVTVANSMTITATTSAHATGAVNVVVTNSDTQSGTLPNGYTYASPNPAPTVTAITPVSGTTAGGTSVSITGTGFLAGAKVSLGGASATSVTVVNSATITATTATHAAGEVNVVVMNSDMQSGTLLNGYTYTASSGGGSIGFVQVKAATPSAPSASVAVTYTVAQTAGNLNIVAVGWNDTTSTVSTVSDSRGNTYALAVGPTSGTGLRQSIYFARNIAAGSNTVTVTFNQAAAFVDLRVLEYRGLDTANPLDVAVGAAGSGTAPSSGPAATTAANELIFGAGMTTTHYTGAGSGFVSRIITTPDADIAEDRIVTASGTYSAVAPVTTSKWVMQMATFRAAP